MREREGIANALHVRLCPIAQALVLRARTWRIARRQCAQNDRAGSFRAQLSSSQMWAGPSWAPVFPLVFSQANAFLKLITLKRSRLPRVDLGRGTAEVPSGAELQVNEKMRMLREAWDFSKQAHNYRTPRYWFQQHLFLPMRKPQTPHRRSLGPVLARGPTGVRGTAPDSSRRVCEHVPTRTDPCRSA